MTDYKIIASSIAVVIALVAYVPYLIDMFRGKNIRPAGHDWLKITAGEVVQRG